MKALSDIIQTVQKSTGKILLQTYFAFSESLLLLPLPGLNYLSKALSGPSLRTVRIPRGVKFSSKMFHKNVLLV